MLTIINTDNIIDGMKKAAGEGVKLAVFPELCITGYTCSDLFLQDILLNCSRISDHCSNIAAAVIEIYERHSYDTHKYLNTVKSGDKIFDNLFEDYSEKYSIE